MTAAEIAEGRTGRERIPQGFKRKLLGHLLTEIGPLLVFFLVFMAKDLIWATAAYAAATLIAFAVTWAKHRKVPVLPMISAALVAIFAGLTLILDDAVFIKVKPTVINGFYGLLLGAGWFFGFRLVEKVLRPQCMLDEAGLKVLTLRTSAYLLGLAILNEIVWRSVSTEAWVIFKVFAMIAFNIAFAWSQLPLVRRHLRPADQGAAPPGPPDSRGRRAAVAAR